MSRQTGSDLGYEYIQQLCQAIEAYTGDAEANNPRAFEYRGANLKYAVERNLYFSFVKNNRLYTFFTQWMRGEPPEVTRLTTKLERDLALYLCGENLAPGRVRVRLLYRLYPCVLLPRLRRWIRNCVHPLSLRLHPVPLPERKEVAVLIYAIVHEKFVRYLRPVVECLPVPSAYLVVMDQKLKPFFVKEGIPFIDTTGLGTRSNGQSLGQVLAKFRNLTTCYDYLYESLRFLKPRCVVVVEGNAPQNEIANQVCQQLSIPVVCLQHGWSPIVHNGFRNMSYTKMLVWGEGFAELLEPYNPNQKFVVTGSHIINSEVVTSRLSHNGGRKAISFFLQSPSGLITKESWDEFLKLVKWVAGEFTEVPILVREHPGYPLASQERADLIKFPNVRLTPAGDYSLAEVLSASCLAVSTYSSTILESIAAGVLPLIFNTTSLPTFSPDVQAAGAGIEVKNLEAARQVVSRILTDATYVQQFKPAIEKFQMKYFYRDNHKAVERIVGEILSLIDTEPVNSDET